MRHTQTPVDVELDYGYDGPTEPLSPARAHYPSPGRTAEPAGVYRAEARRPAEITLADVRGFDNPRTSRARRTAHRGSWWRRLFNG